MGEAYDREGHFLGSAEAASKSEVLEKLIAAHGDKASEIRIRTLEENPGVSRDETRPADRMEQFFAYAHLPPHLQAVSKPFGELAALLIATLPSNAERTVALRKLLESKDCAVRALLFKA